MIHLFKNKNFKLKDVDAGHHKVTYKDVKAIKCPFDYVIYQMIIMDIKPDLIIEIGTHTGGSSLYLADLLELNGKGELHTIDLPSNQEDQQLNLHKRIKVFKNGLLNYDISALGRYNTILVIDDGSHQYEDVLAALEKFSSFISIGSYFIAEDGIVTELGIEKQFNGGPQKAVNDFLQQNNNFIIDRKWCDLFGPNATFNVNGYLKRIS